MLDKAFKTIKRIFPYIFILIIVTSVSFFFYTNRPCGKPITYKLGRVDVGFGLSKADFLNDITKASNIWEKSVGKNLFEYDPNGALTINFIYDERQKAVELRDAIEQKNTVAKSQKEQFDELSTKYDLMKKEYLIAVENFNQDVNNLTREEYNAKRKIIESQRLELNNLSDELNAFVKKYNILIGNINYNVKIVNKTAGEIEEGFYTSKTNSIDIYEYENKTKLIRVLTHEMGHALGLDHNGNPESIMYKLNKGNSESLTDDDIRAIKSLCVSI